MARNKKPPSTPPKAKVRLRVKEVRFKNGTVWKIHTRNENDRLTQMYNHCKVIDESFPDKPLFWMFVAFPGPMEGYVGYNLEPGNTVPLEEIPKILYYKLNEALYETAEPPSEE